LPTSESFWPKAESIKTANGLLLLAHKMQHNFLMTHTQIDKEEKK